jgi:hypothetical protein
MKIYKKDEKIVVEIDAWQPAIDAAGDECGQVENVIGVICGEEQGIAQAIDMTYKDGGIQIGDFIVKTCMEEDSFIAMCRDLGIDYHKYEDCAECKKPIFGCATFNDNGFVCMTCADKK